ncbi:hypothetical protein WN944_026626 [Citrus x changshan-huyou]|uniref:Uncharacterized protein n=1 Tax=Citrus x changshan-huyou TaxID=2935761 RepID=A0AAP0LRZ3_9ROSI
MESKKIIAIFVLVLIFPTTLADSSLSGMYSPKFIISI